MSTSEYAFPKIQVTLTNNKTLLASSIMFPQRGRSEIFLKEYDNEKWLPVDIYLIDKIEFSH
ncbi:MAG: hypothetical protein IPH45_10605 [Bacteroidales bacterium]|jgi:hypothetical protein|nr:hypothetical protein [Bacteroidales bacterium]MBK7172102.1 hypothetical protein [Bacteroidales bacterium]